MNEVDSVEIRLISEHDVNDFWKIRLRALREEPGSFSASYEDEVAKPIGDIISWIRQRSGPENYILGYFRNGLLIGIVGFAREQGAKLRHKGRVWGMYISPEVRGQGIGRLLLTEVIRRSSDLESLEQIVLTVTSRNKPAIQLYENLGFSSYGLEKRALKIGAEYLDDVYMVLPITNK
ncbi:GNAT family N-acetyltransferase [Flavihumibacter sp. R14]|nr:GNAT family N-acetyltransferase [Flavihumibacter soli]